MIELVDRRGAGSRHLEHDHHRSLRHRSGEQPPIDPSGSATNLTAWRSPRRCGSRDHERYLVVSDFNNGPNTVDGGTPPAPKVKDHRRRTAPVAKREHRRQSVSHCPIGELARMQCAQHVHDDSIAATTLSAGMVQWWRQTVHRCSFSQPIIQQPWSSATVPAANGSLPRCASQNAMGARWAQSR